MKIAQMTLGELIAELEKEDPGELKTLGFHEPHSYRGNYADLAFEPAVDIPVAQMLATARHAQSDTFTGYKGGSYHMTADTPVWLANYGHTGRELTLDVLTYLLGAPAGMTEAKGCTPPVLESEDADETL